MGSRHGARSSEDWTADPRDLANYRRGFLRTGEGSNGWKVLEGALGNMSGLGISLDGTGVR